jgi:crotonobetainyl-CoA:carnitine CoA-transferase CaiB-like acyl-CoA transferase
MMRWSYARQVRRRASVFRSSVYPCADGYIGVFDGAGRYWRFVAELMEEPALLNPRFATGMQRTDYGDEIDALMLPWLVQHNREEIFHAAQARRLPFGPIRSMKEIVESPHLNERKYFVTVDHPVAGKITSPGAPFRLPNSPWKAGRAPLLGEHTEEVLKEAESWGPPEPPEDPHANEGGLPLAGVRILDLSWALAGPYATMHLADLGAEVVKVETVQNYDQARGPVDRYDWRTYPIDRSMGRAFNQSSLYNKPNRNKLGITLDLSQEAGVAALKELVKRSDVVIENFSARVLKKHGLEYETLKKIKDDIILVSMPAFGLSGPEKEYIAYGSSLEMISGHTGLRSYGDGPVRSALNYGDPIAGLNAAPAVLAALHQREVTGKGQHVEVAQLEGLTALLGEFIVEYSRTGVLPVPHGNRHPNMAPHGVYPSSENDSWIAIAVRDQNQWKALCDAVGRPELAADPRFSTLKDRKANEDALDEIVRQITSEYTHYDLFQILVEAGVPAGPVLSNEEFFNDTQLLSREFFVPLFHPACGIHLYPGTAAKLSRTPSSVRMAAPTLGQHNKEVLGGMLGMTDEQLAQLEKDEVIGTVPTVDVWAAR